MFWNRPILTTLRSRLAVVYPVSTLLAFIVTLSIVFCFHWKLRLMEIDHLLRTSGEEIIRDKTPDDHTVFWNYISSTSSLQSIEPDPRKANAFAKANKSRYRTLSSGACITSHANHSFYRICFLEVEGARLIVLREIKDVYDELFLMLKVTGVAFLLLLVLLTVLGRVLAKRFTRGLNHIIDVVHTISMGDFSQRLPETQEGKELSKLTFAINHMASNTEHLVKELRMTTDNIAHDLRTPLTRLCGKAEVSLYSHDSTSLANDVAEECSSMLAMINTMLDITRIEHNLEGSIYTPINLSESLRKVAELFSVNAEEKNIQIKLDLPARDIIYAWCEILFQRAIANLVDNALKFTAFNGCITLKLNVDNEKIVFTIKDNGCGIPTDEQSHIFDRFYRSDTSRTIPGFGLGLAMVRAIVHARGGTISVNSLVGKGTHFTISLPLIGINTNED